VTYFADFTDMTLPGGESRADLWVGWLGAEVEQPGSTNSSIRGALRYAKRVNQLPDSTMGSHTCEICGQATGHGQFFIDDAHCRYVLPNLVIHYIAAHSYKLPSDVEHALRPHMRWWRLWCERPG